MSEKIKIVRIISNYEPRPYTLKDGTPMKEFAHKAVYTYNGKEFEGTLKHSSEYIEKNIAAGEEYTAEKKEYNGIQYIKISRIKEGGYNAGGKTGYYKKQCSWQTYELLVKKCWDLAMTFLSPPSEIQTVFDKILGVASILVDTDTLNTPEQVQKEQLKLDGVEGGADTGGVDDTQALHF